MSLNNRLKFYSFLHKINNSKINYEITFEMQFDKQTFGFSHN